MVDNSNKKVLVIVESPNKCKTIKQFLPANYAVVASIGHITEIKDGGDYYNTGINPKNKFEANFVISEDKEKICTSIKEKVKNSDIVYICSDPDREGEAIAWSLEKFLQIPKSKCKRATFHEITKKAVLDAINNPREIAYDLVDAAHARQKVDKMLGYRLSPIARKVLNAKSVGRCQSVGLELVVDREEEIRSFIPETYYDLYLNFQKNNSEYKAKYYKCGNTLVKRITDKEQIKQIKEECKGDFKISNVTQKTKQNKPKPPFITSTFQQEVSSKLGISIQSAMSCAQRLFEGIDLNGKHVALITYIRTDSADISPEFQEVLKDYIVESYGKEYYTPVKNVKKSVNAQEGHEAIRVVDLSMTPTILSKYIQDNILIKVYDLIYKRTVASQMSPMNISETTYEIENEKHKFNFKSQEVLFDGYKKVYSYTDDDEDEELAKDTFSVGETLLDTKLNDVEKTTQPPARYKEATFIKELESSGIGRPSTFATILNTLLDKSRGYCEIQDKCLVPTKKGIELTHYLKEKFSNLININYTSELEKELDKISQGSLSENTFLTNFYDNLESTVKQATKDLPTVNKQVADFVCPNCGKPLYLRTSRFGEFWGCSNYPKCKTALSIDYNEKGKEK